MSDANKSEELLPCPGCMGIKLTKWRRAIEMAVLCEDCGFNAPTIIQWNTRKYLVENTSEKKCIKCKTPTDTYGLNSVPMCGKCMSEMYAPEKNLEEYHYSRGYSNGFKEGQNNILQHTIKNEQLKTNITMSIPERRVPTVEEMNKLSPLPWKLFGLDRPWNEFVEQCNQLSPDKEKYVGYCISAENNDIVCLFGPGPKAYENALMVEQAIHALFAKTEEKQ